MTLYFFVRNKRTYKHKQSNLTGREVFNEIKQMLLGFKAKNVVYWLIKS